MPTDPQCKPILIAGPTASGKSALAVALAERFGGCVINADALQVYAEWRVLTARPDDATMARVPHRLYGHVASTTAYSAGAWLRDVAAAIAACAAAGQRPVIVGGTGLYFRALTHGLAVIPEPGPEARTAAERRFALGGCAALVRWMEEHDPATLAGIDRANPARLIRAVSVREGTGRGLAAWQAATPPPLMPLDACVPLKLLPPVDRLDRAIAQRLAAMPPAGVLDEVAAVARLGLPPQMPAMKAVGAAEFMAHLRGEIDLAAALAQAAVATRRYAKRQRTWMRNQMVSWTTVSAQESCECLAMATDHVMAAH